LGQAEGDDVRCVALLAADSSLTLLDAAHGYPIGKAGWLKPKHHCQVCACSQVSRHV
jgi:hypothetical protein